MSANIYIQPLDNGQYVVHVDGMTIVPFCDSERDAIAQMQMIRRLYGMQG
jgi:hypothetical protein